MGARGALAQGVEYEIADRRAVTGAGKAVGKAPILERVCRWPLSFSDIGKDLYCGAGASSWSH
jgi:hypothetical protein